MPQLVLDLSTDRTDAMSPTVLRKRGYRFFFFSREEPRMHIHVFSPDGEAKFWLDPQIELARNHRLSRTALKEIEEIIEEHQNEIKRAWEIHFGS
jgi:hypothetical protein